MPKWDLFGFVDESGTAGVRSGETDEFLVLSLVIFRDEAEMKKVHKQYSELRKKIGRGEAYEFHYTHNRQKVKEQVFDLMREINFEFVTFAIRKDGVKRHASYITMAEVLVNYLQRKKLSVKTIIDTNPVLLKNLNKLKKAKAANNLLFKQEESVNNDCLQLADYVVGAHSKIIRGHKEVNFNKIQDKLKALQVYKYN